MYECTTQDIRVTVNPTFIEEQSNPDLHRYFWAYHVFIENLGTTTVQLQERYWKITDATGAVEEVRGPGVVGEQPILQPGEHFEYASGCPLTTPSGFMMGVYMMRTEEGERFDVAIPAFSLDIPDEQPSIN